MCHATARGTNAFVACVDRRGDVARQRRACNPVGADLDLRRNHPRHVGEGDDQRTVALHGRIDSDGAHRQQRDRRRRIDAAVGRRQASRGPQHLCGMRHSNPAESDRRRPAQRAPCGPRDSDQVGTGGGLDARETEVEYAATQAVIQAEIHVLEIRVRAMEHDWTLLAAEECAACVDRMRGQPGLGQRGRRIVLLDVEPRCDVERDVARGDRRGDADGEGGMQQQREADDASQQRRAALLQAGTESVQTQRTERGDERQQRISHVERRRRAQPRDQRRGGNGREQSRGDGQRLAPGGEQESGQRRQLEREDRDDRGHG